jgi:DNA-binding transcriptional LysR family regulator
MPYEFRQLQHFIEVARHGNYARAAEALGLAQPTLTRSIQALERQVGARLLDRGRSGATPTVLGKELLGRARTLLRQAEETERDMQLLAGLGAGRLRIGAGTYAADISVGTAVARFSRKHPGVTIDLAINDWTVLIGQLLEGEIDVAVAEISTALEQERLDVEPLPRHRGKLFCRKGHPLLERDRDLTAKDLADFPFVTSTLPQRMKDVLDTSAPRPGHAARYRADTFDLIRRIGLESDAVAAAVPIQIAADLASGRVVPLPLELPGIHTAYGIIRLAGRTPSPAAIVFIEELRRIESELAESETPGPRGS